MRNRTISCFFLTPVPQGEARLRCYSLDGCSVGGGHEAVRTLGVCNWGDDLDSWGYPLDESPASPYWPTHCDKCGQELSSDVSRQGQVLRLFERDDTGALTLLKGAAPGAMWFADHYPWKGPDGRTLVVMTPGGEWVVDGPASNSDGVSAWQRQGVPPRITASPSIVMDGYHGWLRDGILVEV